MTKLWETDNYIEENTLTVNVGRLRKKLEKAGMEGFIKTKVGGGSYHREGVKMFLQYLKRIRFVLLWSLLCAGIFFLIFVLEEINLKAAVYPTVLCLAFWITFSSLWIFAV